MGINGKDEVFKNKNTFKAKYQQYLEAVIFLLILNSHYKINHFRVNNFNGTYIYAFTVHHEFENQTVLCLTLSLNDFYLTCFRVW